MTLASLYQDLQRFGVDVEKLKQCNPTELQLIDLVGGLEVCFRCSRELVNAGELVNNAV